MKKLLFILIIILFLPQKENAPKEFKCDKDHTIRIGCICKDGTKSSATGKGACSKHKGVRYWICK